MGWRITWNPPIKREFAFAATWLGLQVGFDLDSDGMRQLGRVGDEINAGVGAHWRRLDAAEKKLVLHQQLAALANLSFG